MAEWLEDHMAAIGPFKTQLCLVVRLWLNWRSGGAHRWKWEDHRLGKSGSSVWKAGTFKAIASACDG
jgi:hypothetical protein